MALPETPQEQIQHLSKKLRQSIQSRKQLEDDYLRDTQRYAHFANELCLALSGVDTELDGLLYKLRGHLQQNASVAVLDPMIQALSEAIAQHTVRQQKLLKDTNQTIDTAIKTAVPKNKDEQRLISDIASDFEHPSMTLSHYLPLVNALLSFAYQQPIAKSSSQTADYQNQLLDILSEVEFSGNAAEVLEHVKVSLQKPQSTDVLLTISLKVLRLVFNNIADARKSAQQFLQQLNASLESVQNVLSHTVTCSTDFSEQRHALNQQLQSNVSDITTQVCDACHLADLKDAVAVQLGQLSDTIRRHISLHDEERQHFNDNTQSMEQQLHNAEAQLSQYKKELAKQKFRSLRDGLTKLPNRSAFEERINIEYERWRAKETELTIAIIDVDNFKRINDGFGHTAGDKTLQVIAGTLTQALSGRAFVCRYGGEEFAIVFATDQQIACQFIDNTRGKVENIPFKFKTEDIRITISAGIATFNSDEDTPVAVFERADKALYRAKTEGRNRVITAE